jgi:hypothetical protein
MKQSGMEITLRLRNDYDRILADYMIGFIRLLGEDGTVANYLSAQEPIEPGATFDVSFTFPLHGDSQKTSPHQLEVVIAAVLFEDSTSDGDKEKAVEMAAKRLGQRFEISRLIPLLKNIIDLPDMELAAGLPRFEKEIEAQSVSSTEISEAVGLLEKEYRRVIEQQKPVSESKIRSSLYLGHLKVSSEIPRVLMRSSPSDPAQLRDELRRLKEELEKKLSRL